MHTSSADGPTCHILHLSLVSSLPCALSRALPPCPGLTCSGSGLSRLIKVLQRADYSDATKVGKLAVIPEKATIARRLAQSMNPILPSGVHRKALDVYRIILARIGGEQLAADLALWSQGLFSLFPHANEECKQFCVKLITDSYLPLGPHLVPSLDGLILALAPALEDEAAACFQPTVALISEIQSAVGQYEFFRTLWWVLGAGGSGRQQILLLLQRSLPAGGGLQAPHVLPDPRVAVRGLVLALEDGSILVQRAVLDLLLSHVPFASAALPDLVAGEEEVCDERGVTSWMVLTRAAVRLYARRDMSLTRRLHLWLSPPAHALSEGNGADGEVGEGGESGEGGAAGGGAGLEHGDKEEGGGVMARFVFLISWAVQRLLQEAYLSRPTDSLSATLPLRVARAILDKGGSWSDGRQGSGGALARALVVPLMQALHRTGVDKRQGSLSREGTDERLHASERYHFAVNTLRDLDMDMVWHMLHQHLAACLARCRPAGCAHTNACHPAQVSTEREGGRDGGGGAQLRGDWSTAAVSEALSLARCFFSEFLVVHPGWGVENGGEGECGREGGGREDAVQMCMRVLTGALRALPFVALRAVSFLCPPLPLAWCVCVCATRAHTRTRTPGAWSRWHEQCGAPTGWVVLLDRQPQHLRSCVTFCSCIAVCLAYPALLHRGGSWAMYVCMCVCVVLFLLVGFLCVSMRV